MRTVITRLLSCIVFSAAAMLLSCSVAEESSGTTVGSLCDSVGFTTCDDTKTIVLRCTIDYAYELLQDCSETGQSCGAGKFSEAVCVGEVQDTGKNNDKTKLPDLDSPQTDDTDADTVSETDVISDADEGLLKDGDSANDSDTDTSVDADKIQDSDNSDADAVKPDIEALPDADTAQAEADTIADTDVTVDVVTVDTDVTEYPDTDGNPLVWLDPATGNMWQIQNDVTSRLEADAETYCNGLNASSYAGYNSGWRMPTVSELRSIMLGCASTQTGGACAVTDACTDGTTCWTSPNCNACAQGSGCYWNASIKGSCSVEFWSSTPNTHLNGYYWSVDFKKGWVNSSPKESTFPVRCVRK